MSRYEKETIINFNEEEIKAQIYTCSEITSNRLDKLCKEFPEQYKLIKEEGTNKYYECDKKLVLNFKKPRILTDEQKKIMSERAKKMLSVRNKTIDQF